MANKSSMLNTNKVAAIFKKSLLLSGVSLALSFSALAQDEAQTPISIAKLSDARVFADFTEKLPAVLNYFTKASEQEVVAFYQNNYGEVISQERKRGRLTLNFSAQQQTIRVVISQQNRLRQVDVIVEAGN